MPPLLQEMMDPFHTVNSDFFLHVSFRKYIYVDMDGDDDG